MGIFILKPEEKEINFFTYYTKMNFKGIIDLNMKGKTIKLLGNYRRNILGLRTRQRISRLDIKSMIHRRKNSKIELDQN